MNNSSVPLISEPGPQIAEQPVLGQLASHEITKAIWAAKLTTKEIRGWFPVSEYTDEKGALIRYYVISPIGWHRILPFVDRTKLLRSDPYPGRPSQNKTL
jgi:hypothetical protein